MNAFTLHAPTDRASLRWIGSAAVIVAVHAGLIAAGIYWYREQPTPGAPETAIMIDMAPATAAPQAQPDDVAAGPEMQQAEEQSAPPPEPPPQQVEQPIEPTPPMAKPEVETPPEQKAEPAPPPPEPAKVTPEPPKPTPVKPKPVRAEVKKKPPSEAPAAPRTTAPPRAQRQAVAASGAPSAGASRAASVSYNQLVAAQLQRYKQYPSTSKAAGEQGVARISFTLDRNGRLMSARLARSSGHPALDAEVLAVVRRAQPFPPFPAEKIGSSDSFDVPISFYLR